MEACALALQSEDLRKREREGERRSDLNDTNIAWPVRASGRKVAAYFFYNFRLSCGCVPDVLRVGFF